MVVEVDRFDVGRAVGPSLQPTAVVPGDVVIYCTVSGSANVCLCSLCIVCVQVGPEEAPVLSDSLVQAELLKTLRSSIVSTEPASLLHLHIHIRTHQSNSFYSSIPSLTISCTV